MAAAKALKKATAGPAPVAAGQGKKKEKKVAEVVVEDPYVEVPAGQFKGKQQTRTLEANQAGWPLRGGELGRTSQG